MVSNEKINSSTYKTVKILVAPLDWGLGHATRCIPIIKELINQQCEVWIAATGVQRTLLQEEFPFVPFVELPGYEIKYGKNRALTIFRLLCSIPKILIRIKQEKAWLKEYIIREKPDLILSDNRYGLRSPEVFSIFMTHQLMIHTPFGSWGNRWLQRMNYRQLRSFQSIWVPDAGGDNSLGGELSHPETMPSTLVRYIGWLSRFEKTEMPEGSPDLLVLLSGPEPQRTLLEEELLKQLANWREGMPGGDANCKSNVVLVRGLPAGGQYLNKPEGIEIYDHLPAKDLEPLIRSAKFVLARSGYSTVMDLARLKKRAILIPTPGQTEQEYLGRYLADRGWALCITQSAFSLTTAMEAARVFRFQPIEEPVNDLLREAVADVLSRLRSPDAARPGL